MQGHFLEGSLALYESLTGRENIELFASLYGLAGAARRERVDAALGFVSLADRGGDRVASWSGGMKRRLNHAAAVVHDPEVVLLDEPTAGVDPQSRNLVLDNVLALRDRGRAIVYTTHYMEEAERLCDRIGIVDLGELEAEGTRSELVALVGQHDRIQLQGTGDLLGERKHRGQFIHITN